jgi:probable rRNA maturation factor
MKISIVNSQKIVKLDLREIKSIAAGALGAIEEKEAELSIYFVDDAQIRNLNYRYRGFDKPTDVLAFSMRDGEALRGAEGILGDVVVSTETAVNQARRFRKDVKDEIALYLIHGVLHLAGYDDTSPSERKKMQKKQKQIFASRGFYEAA